MDLARETSSRQNEHLCKKNQNPSVHDGQNTIKRSILTFDPICDLDLLDMNLGFVPNESINA